MNLSDYELDAFSDSRSKTTACDCRIVAAAKHKTAVTSSAVAGATNGATRCGSNGRCRSVRQNDSYDVKAFVLQLHKCTSSDEADASHDHDESLTDQFSSPESSADTSTPPVNQLVSLDTCAAVNQLVSLDNAVPITPASAAAETLPPLVVTNHAQTANEQHQQCDVTGDDQTTTVTAEQLNNQAPAAAVVAALMNGRANATSQRRCNEATTSASEQRATNQDAAVDNHADYSDCHHRLVALDSGVVIQQRSAAQNQQENSAHKNDPSDVIGVDGAKTQQQKQSPRLPRNSVGTKTSNNLVTNYKHLLFPFQRLSSSAQSLVNFKQQTTGGVVSSRAKKSPKDCQHRSAMSQAERQKRKTARKRERRATLVLGVIMVTFIVCWLPFFGTYLTSTLLGFAVPEMVFAVMFWAGYCNSALNPIIYTIFNKEFRKAFKKIMFRRR